MLNFIRADFYRLLHTKSFWIAEVIITVMAFISIVSMTSFVVQVEDLSTAGEGSANALTGYSAVGQSLGSALIYYMLPLVILVLGSEYSKGTLKNIITTGVSRTSYFLGKFLSFTVVMFLQIIWLALIGFVVGTISGGTGFSATNTMDNIVYQLLGQLIILLAISSVTTLVLYLTKNTAVSVIVSIVWPMATAVAAMMNSNSTLLDYINFQSKLDQVAATTLSTMGDVVPTFISAIILTVLFISLTNWYFNKQDL